MDTPLFTPTWIFTQGVRSKRTVFIITFSTLHVKKFESAGVSFDEATLRVRQSVSVKPKRLHIYHNFMEERIATLSLRT